MHLVATARDDGAVLAHDRRVGEELGERVDFSGVDQLAVPEHEVPDVVLRAHVVLDVAAPVARKGRSPFTVQRRIWRYWG